MVTRPYFADDDEPPFHRRNSRGHEFPLSHDRGLPLDPYNGPRDHLPSHDSRRGNRAPEPDSNSRPRSRIPVAVRNFLPIEENLMSAGQCGRCRKRKIRCSGDVGAGLPCSNCKSAGHEHCQFLRVSHLLYCTDALSLSILTFWCRSHPPRHK